MKVQIKIIKFNFSIISEIKKAERQKIRLENSGFTLVNTTNYFSGLTVLTYSK